MELRGTERINLLLSSIETEFYVAGFLFWLLGFTLTFLVKRNHGLSAKESLHFIAGLKIVKLSWKERFLLVATITVPLLIIYLAIQSNNATL